MRSWVEVSLGRIRANFRAVRALVGDAVEVMPVVKADAYRHGAVAVSRALEAEGEALAVHHLTPVIHSLEDLPSVAVPYHLKIDSGMSRLGTLAAPDEIARVVAAAPAPIEGLMTHFASSGNYESRQTEEQLE